MPAPESDPKQKFVKTALKLFSDRGYYGVSLADVAGELGLTKQSVLYHFKTKDALYGAVIADIANRLDALLEDILSNGGQSEQRILDFLDRMYQHMRETPRDARLITRELLDNVERAESRNRWYLKRFLDETVSLVAAHPNWQHRQHSQQMAAAYQIIGAVSYAAISGPTLKAIWGEEALEQMSEGFLPALKQQWTG